MASFKLGCIVGEKGDRGDRGAKGERGEKGDRGDSGAIPVFEIADVETVAPGISASVEIDASDPEMPKLSFRIPRGKDGKDAMGDMLSGIYDSEGKKADIYKFAEALFEKALSKTGGGVTGKLFVHQSPENESCVRNILFAPSLPEKASEGDICFITAEEYENTIYNNGIGSILLIPEGEDKYEYIVAAKDYHGEGSVTLVRKNLVQFEGVYNFTVRDSYYCSNIDYFMESVFVRMYPDYIQKMMRATLLSDYHKRTCFIPSYEEIMNMEYFKNNPYGAVTDTGGYREYMTRTLDNNKSVISVTALGEISAYMQSQKSGIRPVIVLEGSLLVRNCMHNGNAAVEVARSNRGYYYSEGKWKELF